MKFYLAKNVYQTLSSRELAQTIQELGRRGTACASWLEILNRQDQVNLGQERLVA